MGKGALCPFLDYNGIKYKFVHQKGAVDKMLSHFITALDSYSNFAHPKQAFYQA